MKFRRALSETDLSGRWNFAFSGESHPGITLKSLEQAGLTIFPCTVPGALETDLHAVGKFPEPFFGLNILKAQSYERHHVWYGCRFPAEVPTCTEPWLVFEGIDTCAEIYLNGQHLGSVANMFMEHAFRVGHLLRAENELLIHIRPAIVEAEKYEVPAGLGAPNLSYESLHIRKAAHMYGWDIMPRAVSAGIWRPVRLRFLPRERLEDVYLETARLSADHATADMILHYQTSVEDSEAEIVVEGRCGESRFTAAKPIPFRTGRLAINVPQPKLWWPRGFGELHLYEITVRLLSGGTEIDRVSFTHGIRTIELEKTSTVTESGEGWFRFRVNGEPIFIKGTNWVPADAFHWRDAERIPKILPMVLECNCNLLRCWGGNVYEDDAFFDWCDRSGVMVWQDFAMACAIYPQDADFQQRLQEEARRIVRRLRQHASLVVWAGDNECDQAHGWHHGGDPNRNVVTRVTLPGVLKEEDPNRPYLPSSPYIDPTAYAVGEKYLPENHLWGPRDYYKSDYYAKALCQFASEIGYHGAPNFDSLRRFISSEKLWPPQDNAEWILHSTDPKMDGSLFPGAEYRVNLMLNQVRVLFGDVPDSLEEFISASQASQAEALKFFIERFREGKEGWRRTGIVWWNLMDGWPQLSDAVVDYYFGRKMAFDFIRRSQADVCFVVREAIDARLQIVGVNDTRREVQVDYTVRDVASGREVLTQSVRLPANTAVTVAEIPHDPAVQGMFGLAWNGPGITGTNHYLAGKPPYDLKQYRSWFEAAGVR